MKDETILIKKYLEKDKPDWEETKILGVFRSNHLEGILIGEDYLRYIEDIRAKHIFTEHHFPKSFEEFLKIVGRN